MCCDIRCLRTQPVLISAACAPTAPRLLRRPLRRPLRVSDEIYGLIERLTPGTRKLELFGRSHNIQPNWTTLGNQLDGIQLVEEDVIERFHERLVRIFFVFLSFFLSFLFQHAPFLFRGLQGPARLL
jgi:hypothetical protein